MPDRSRHLRGHPDRHPGRRAARRRGRPSGLDRRRRPRRGGGGLSDQPGIPTAPPPEPGLVINPNPLTETWHQHQVRPGEPHGFSSILGISWFLALAPFLAQFPPTPRTFWAARSAVTLLRATFTVGIGIGSLLCERMSGKRVEIRLVPFGSIGLTVLDSTWPGLRRRCCRPRPLGLGGAAGPRLDLARPFVDLLLLGMFGGFSLFPSTPWSSCAAPRPPGPHHRQQQHPQRPCSWWSAPWGGGAAQGGLSILMLFAVGAID